MRIGQSAIRNARAAARSGRNVLADEAERAVDALLAGPLPEAVARSIVRHRVVQRVVTEALEESGTETGGRDPIELAVERAVATPAFRQALLEVMSSTEVRHALTNQTVGFGEEIAASVRRRAAAADLRVGAARARSPQYGGPAGRGIALIVDLLLAHLVFLVASASAALVASLAGTLRPEWVVGVIAGAGWLIVVGVYFVAFWSGTGRTPGMQLMRLRVVTAAGGPPGVARSIVRFVGLVLAVVPLFAGFLPVFVDRRRRALQDFLAGTVVVRQTG